MAAVLCDRERLAAVEDREVPSLGHEHHLAASLRAHRHVLPPERVRLLVVVVTGAPLHVRTDARPHRRKSRQEALARATQAKDGRWAARGAEEPCLRAAQHVSPRVAVRMKAEP